MSNHSTLPFDNVELSKTLDRLGERVREREQREPQPPPAPKSSAKVVQLPLWDREAPAAPNVALRSALFAAIHSKDRRLLKNETVAAVGDVEIKFMGQQLNQDDLDVLLACENIAREHPDTLTAQITERGFLRLLGRRPGKTNEKALADSLMRLEQPVTIKMGRFSYSSGFVHHIYKDDETKRYVVQLNARLGALLRTGWTALNTETRRQLAGKPLAQWLQASYATHAKPYPLSVEYLREKSGSRTVALRHFRENLRRALDDWKATGDILAWEIDANDYLHITKAKRIRHK